jgi:hypothetical protein
MWSIYVKKYLEIYKELGFWDMLERYEPFREKYFEGSTNFEDYDVPPCFIPIEIDTIHILTPTYTGIVKHWFSDRPMYFYSQNFDPGWFHDICDEFIDYFNYQVCWLIGSGKSVDDEFIKDAESIGVSREDVLIIEKIYNKRFFHENVLGYLKIKRILNSEDPNYVNKNLKYKDRNQMCDYETDYQPTRSDYPRGSFHLSNPDSDKKALFAYYLNRNDFHGAWMSLCCHGWKNVDAAQAILLLAKKAKHEPFSRYARLWAANQADSDDGY